MKNSSRSIVAAVLFLTLTVIAVGCGGSGSGDGTPNFSVSGDRITIPGLGECGDYNVYAGGAISFNVDVTCNGDSHTLSFTNVQYCDGEVASFDVTVDGEAHSYSTGVECDVATDIDLDDESEPVNLSFDCALTDYEDGWGTEGEDTIIVDSITGPSGASVGAPLAGEYIAKGQYKLTNYDNAKIDLWFSGEARISGDVFQEIEGGEGSFEVRSTLVEIFEGTGRLIIKMVGGRNGDYSDWMFDVMPAIGDECN